ncbi:methyl-accepting chemotaxis protein [Cylindrospermopsis raciborskii]|uniref:methyl-accepting chemotaxis protein n=1 Tax=Cylindrospermopsis raciborskii TaxID=77022 RepID=UPI000778E011|nr:methyl-accepting chemotaxis protein [Cylindrospermopsis raciborskii]MCZ2201163.1 methyl-accepting chemotaxis protein [Cylindrospermopsis raciborskii PAMP2012]MCZ2205864.1 methyl-accepting chemotaxis protein [Cylindrospermopsis raciborskii PAMP2011]
MINTDEPNFKYKQALTAYIRGDYQGAATLIDQVVSILGEDPNSHLLRGDIYYALGKFKVAKAEYNRVLGLTNNQEILGSARQKLQVIEQELVTDSSALKSGSDGALVADPSSVEQLFSDIEENHPPHPLESDKKYSYNDMDKIEFLVNFDEFDDLKSISSWEPVEIDENIDTHNELAGNHNQRLLEDKSVSTQDPLPENVPVRQNSSLNAILRKQQWSTALVVGFTSALTAAVVGFGTSSWIPQRNANWGVPLGAGIISVITAASMGGLAHQSVRRAFQEQNSGQSKELAGTLNSVVTMTQSLEEFRKIGKAAQTSVHRVNEINNQVSEVLENMVAEILVVGETLTKTEPQLKYLVESCQEINSLATLAFQLASRTNLLTLNVSIEATKSGVGGRGLAIMANEISQLADKTAKSVKQIQGMLGNIDKEANHLILTMEGSKQRVINSTKLAQQARQSLDDITPIIADIDSSIDKATLNSP